MFFPTVVQFVLIVGLIIALASLVRAMSDPRQRTIRVKRVSHFSLILSDPIAREAYAIQDENGDFYVGHHGITAGSCDVEEGSKLKIRTDLLPSRWSEITEHLQSHFPGTRVLGIAAILG